jgi:ferredoxin
MVEESMSHCENRMRQRAAELLSKGEVVRVLGYETGTLPGLTRPVVIDQPEDANRLVYNDQCRNNLSSYLPQLAAKNKVAVVVRPCDARTLVSLIQEKQIERDKVHVIAFRSSGQDAEPPIYDTLIDADVEPLAAPLQGYQVFSKKSAEERWKAFEDEMARCIRCYACRNACPMCYCKECFVERTLPRWVGEGSNVTDTMIFHITRAIHVAGRCGECDACVRACPMGIDLKIINQKLNEDLFELYGHRAGVDPDEPAALSTFDPNDYNDFIK